MTAPGSTSPLPDRRLEELSDQVAQLLDQQAATNDVLRAIGQPEFELQPIFETVLENAMRLCRAHAGQIFIHEGDHYRLACASGGSDEYRSVIAARRVPLGSGTLAGRVGLERRAMMIADIATDPEYDTEEQRLRQRLGGFRTIVGVPMLSEDDVIGVISLWRSEVNSFTDREVELATTFAAQGAIAIRNANLMQQLGSRTRELARSVDQVEGLRKVGEAVSSSLDLDVVLSAIVRHAVELSGTEGGSIFEFDDDEREFHVRTAYGTSEELVDALRRTHVGIHNTLVGRAASTGTSLAVPDIAEAASDPHLTQLLRAGWRSMLAVPLVRTNRILGALVVRRRAPGEFSPQITDLMETFASQSALAIHNARLFRELERKTAELEVAGRHKSEFLASMSHELRTPLNAVIGFSEVLLDRLFGDVNAKQEEYLEDIRASGRHLLELLNDILDLSKVEAGKMELDLVDVSLRHLIEDAVAMVRDRAIRKGLTLEVAVDDDVDAVTADPLRLKQVVVNLITNAVKFTPDGGRIDVRAEHAGGEYRVEVRDTGVGIAETDQQRIFDAFQQGPRTVSESAEGTGLGLTLSRQIVKLHGGRLWVASRAGEGSTFTFAIPVSAPARAPEPDGPAAARGESADGRGRTVLVVEDDPRSLELMTLYLRGSGFDVRAAPDAEQGLELARRLEPDAIVLDIVLPGLDGWDLLALLKSEARTARIPVVIVSMLDERGRGFALGAADYLVKPVGREDVVAALARCTTAAPVTVVTLTDDPLVLELLDAVAADDAYRVLAASTGEGVLALARSEHPDVIVVDVFTDGVDVFEVVEELRAGSRTAIVPIVVLTSEAMTAESKRRLHGQIDRMAGRTELDRRMLTDLVGSLADPRGRAEGR